MANQKIYIHEFVDIIGHNRAAYIHHMTANWGPIGHRERNMLCVGVFATVGSTEKWPQTVNLWELDGWKGMASNFRTEFSHAGHQDPKLAEWWAKAAMMRSGGYDRLLVPAPYSRTLEENIAAGVKGEVYYHEQIQVVPGKAKEYLVVLEQEFLPLAERLGLQLVGAYRTAMVNDSEVIVIWAIPDWDTWADLEMAYESDPDVAAWRARIQGLAVDWRNKLMCPGPLTPLNTGEIL